SACLYVLGSRDGVVTRRSTGLRLFPFGGGRRNLLEKCRSMSETRVVTRIEFDRRGRGAAGTRPWLQDHRRPWSMFEVERVHKVRRVLVSHSECIQVEAFLDEFQD